MTYLSLTLRAQFHHRLKRRGFLTMHGHCFCTEFCLRSIVSDPRRFRPWWCRTLGVNRERPIWTNNGSLGLSSITGSVPGPIIFGAAFDGSCTLWEKRCNVKGSCLAYDNVQLGTYMFLVCGGVKLLALIFIFIAWRVYKPPTGNDVISVSDVKESEKIEKEKESVATLEKISTKGKDTNQTQGNPVQLTNMKTLVQTWSIIESILFCWKEIFMDCTKQNCLNKLPHTN